MHFAQVSAIFKDMTINNRRTTKGFHKDLTYERVAHHYLKQYHYLPGCASVRKCSEVVCDTVLGHGNRSPSSFVSWQPCLR